MESPLNINCFMFLLVRLCAIAVVDSERQAIGALHFSKTDDRQENLVAQIGTTPQNILMLLLTKARLVTQLRKQKKLLKVMALFAKKSHITNSDVAKLLHVSNATALRYLTQLERENKIVQVGKTGHAVSYKKI